MGKTSLSLPQGKKSIKKEGGGGGKLDIMEEKPVMD